MPDVIHPPTVTNAKLAKRLRGGVKFTAVKNEDGTFTATIDKNKEVIGKGHTEREALFAAEKSLNDLIQKKGILALKPTKDLEQ